MNEQQSIKIDLAKLFPEAARRVEILAALKKNWPQVVGPVLAQKSQPYNLGVNELCIFVNNKQAGNMLSKMKGNILRALARWKYKPDGDFVLKITEHVPAKRTALKKSRGKNISEGVKIDNEAVKKCMEGAPETLPEDINRAISHLKIFLEKRFPSS